ncbi:prolyl-tRNA synthetase [Phlyctochytrium arcticum]|nr:prolyl-tRNA synthetase [Phlyctochytrium arcticum]
MRAQLRFGRSGAGKFGDSATHGKDHGRYAMSFYNRLSKIWVPHTRQDGAFPKTAAPSLKLLLSAGFIRQSGGAGIYSMLPLAVRTLERLEKLISREMASVGAQRVALPCLLSSKNWHKTKRWNTGGELFTLHDRKGTEFCLSPTHEEEITALVAAEVSSYRDLPLRLYQIGRKYRDEARPRSGLLRAREFIMKDLYTFDTSEAEARKTYEEVRAAYDRIFTQIGVPFVAANADSGSIGGSVSHEYLFTSSVGEDSVLTCNKCSYVANVETGVGVLPSELGESSNQQTVPFSVQEESGKVTTGKIILPAGRQVNLLKLQKHRKLVNTTIKLESPSNGSTACPADLIFVDHSCHYNGEANIGDFVLIEAGDACASCSELSYEDVGLLETSRAIEIGHTFLLGTKYSMPLNATFKNSSNEVQPIFMGCYGIGISRMLPAIVEANHDKDGLKWPLALAPYAANIIYSPGDLNDEVAHAMYEKLETLLGEDRVVLDDRTGAGIGGKLRFAKLLGVPYSIVLGKDFTKTGFIEVHVRQTGEIHKVDSQALHATIQSVLPRQILSM